LISTVTDNGSHFVKAVMIMQYDYSSYVKADFVCEIDCNFQTDDLELNGMKKYINSSMVFVLNKLF